MAEVERIHDEIEVGLGIVDDFEKRRQKPQPPPNHEPECLDGRERIFLEEKARRLEREAFEIYEELATNPTLSEEKPARLIRRPPMDARAWKRSDEDWSVIQASLRCGQNSPLSGPYGFRGHYLSYRAISGQKSTAVDVPMNPIAIFQVIRWGMDEAEDDVKDLENYVEKGSVQCRHETLRSVVTETWKNIKAASYRDDMDGWTRYLHDRGYEIGFRLSIRRRPSMMNILLELDRPQKSEDQKWT